MSTDATAAKEEGESPSSAWPKILSAVRSPLSLFALVILVCNAIFALAAAKMNNLEAFKFTIHMFLGVLASFVMIAIWSPRSLYHPDEIKDIGTDRLPGYDSPLRIFIPIVLLASVGLYMWYQHGHEKLRQMGAEAQKTLIAKPSESSQLVAVVEGDTHEHWLCAPVKKVSLNKPQANP